MQARDTDIRAETPEDVDAIGVVTRAAFAGAAHSSGTEGAIVEALREAGALKLSLVAVQGGAVVGHIAFSPVTIEGRSIGWFGLGPVSVRPDRQRGGVGAALIEAGLDRLRRGGAAGCVVLGDPGYYRRFGFAADARLRYPQAPAAYFQRLAFAGPPPTGTVAYHQAFGAA